MRRRLKNREGVECGMWELKGKEEDDLVGRGRKFRDVLGFEGRFTSET